MHFIFTQTIPLNVNWSLFHCTALFEYAIHVQSVFMYVLNVHALMYAEISDKDPCNCYNLLSMAVTQNLSNLESMTTSQRHICTYRTLINHVTTFFPISERTRRDNTTQQPFIPLTRVNRIQLR